MLELIGTALSAIVSGGATGLLGVILQRWFDFKNKAQDLEIMKAKQAHELALRDKDVEQTKAEWAGRNQVAFTEGEAKVSVAEAEALGESYKNDKASYITADAVKDDKWSIRGLTLVDVVRGLVRPGLTVYLIVITQIMYQEIQELMNHYGATLTAAQVYELNKLIIGTVLYLAVTCVTWWFGTRNKGQLPSTK